MTNYGSWHWLPAFLLPSLLHGLITPFITRFVAALNLPLASALWVANILVCLLLYSTRVLWITSTCKRYSDSKFYRVFTYAFMCFFVCMATSGTLVLNNKGYLSSNPSTDAILSGVYTATPFLVMGLSFLCAKKHISPSRTVNHL